MVKECIDRLIYYIIIYIKWMEHNVIKLQIFRQQNDSIMVISMLCNLKKKYIQ